MYGTLSVQSIANQKKKSKNLFFGMHWCHQVLIIFWGDYIQQKEVEIRMGHNENVYLVCHMQNIPITEANVENCTDITIFLKC